MLNLLSLIGMGGLCWIAWLGSEDRRLISWKLVAWGLGLQLGLGLLVFIVPVTRLLFLVLNDLVNEVLDASEAGARFLFGPALVPDPAAAPGPLLAGRWIARAITPPYAPVPGDRLTPDNLNLGFIFAFRALPQVVFFSALLAFLYNLRLVQPVVRAFARVFRHRLDLSGAEALAGAANIFVGIESAIAIKPFLATLTRSEFCTVLTCCFGSIASTVLAVYAGFLRPTLPTITGHLISASVLSIPACFVVSKILVPEGEIPQTLGELPEEVFDEASLKQSPTESLIVGATEGVKLAVSIAALLIAVLGLVAIVNSLFINLANLAASEIGLLRWVGQLFSVVSLQNLLGALFLPLTFLTGVSVTWPELWQASVLVGQRMILTEIPSYQAIAQLANAGVLGDRAVLVVSYTLCGFAHLPSLAIFVGGFSALAPTRRSLIADIAWKALWAATLATLMTGCVAGVMFWASE
jgi:CNT family concentrative nucleoside transporter